MAVTVTAGSLSASTSSNITYLVRRARQQGIGGGLKTHDVRPTAAVLTAPPRQNGAVLPARPPDRRRRQSRASRLERCRPAQSPPPM